ncbi:MAG: hypothetical protein M1833_004226 [Piccolia ochrophora]|nr:MAG: hypothetical protein M1833_004226 [Piccolia ochrophora]
MSSVASPSKRGATSPSTLSAGALPPPSTFDIVPPIYTLLSRLITSNSTAEPPLEPHQLATEASALKIRLSKARAAVEALPDMGRSIEEQELEKRELQDRIRQQQDVLSALRTRIRGSKVEDADGGDLIGR